MKTAAIICEYNPFHNGHKHHIEITKKICQTDAIVGLMSGSFVERGEPAVYDKWTRAKACLLNGIDLVLELPLYYTLQGGELFALGAVTLLEKLHTINILSFGAEQSNLELLDFLANLFNCEDLQYKNTLKSNLEQGFSYAKARENTVISLYGEKFENILDRSNNILAIEYLRALKTLSSSISPFLVSRSGDPYREKQAFHKKFTSATAIRSSIAENKLGEVADYLPPNVMAEIRDMTPLFLEDFSEILLHLIRTADPISAPEVSEGIENRFRKMALRSQNIKELISLCQTKRYPSTKIKRILCQLLLNIKKEDAPLYENPNYVRVLGFNERGKKLLNKIKDNSSLDIITNINQEKLSSHPGLALDLKGDVVYFSMNKNFLDPTYSYGKKPFILT